jgi:hypothetical protein
MMAGLLTGSLSETFPMQFITPVAQSFLQKV